MAAYKTGAFVRSKTPLKWIPRSKSGASKSRPRWAAHTRIGNVWEYPPGPTFICPAGISVVNANLKSLRRNTLRDSTSLQSVPVFQALVY